MYSNALSLHALLIWFVASALATSGVAIRPYVEHSLWLTRCTICVLLAVESALVAILSHGLTGVALDTAFMRALIFIGFAMIISFMMTRAKM